MFLTNILTYVFFNFLLFLSLFLILNGNVFISVLLLALLFIFIAIFLILLKFEFIGYIYLLLYVGALVVMLMFILMFLNLKIESYRKILISYFNLDFLFYLIFFF